MALRVCVLQPAVDEDITSELKGLDPPRTPEIHDAGAKYTWHHAFIRKATAVQQVRDLAKSKRFDVFLNLCDGAWDEDRAGLEVVTALDRHGCAYTGADARFYEPSKELMKKMAFYYDIPTAPWAFVYDIDMQDDSVAAQQCRAAVEGLDFPLIVKHFNGYSSVGMGKDCKVSDLPSLVSQVRKFVGQYGGALVEQFIRGREFTVLVVEEPSQPDCPRVLLPVECCFGPGEEFKHFDLKWREYEGIGWTALDAAAEPDLDRQLRRLSARAFVALKGCSYGRCDFRVDGAGRVVFLEINPNCGIFYPRDAQGSADVILDLDPLMGPAAFLDHILSCALARAAAKTSSRLTEVRYRHKLGYALHTTRDIAPGETVVRFEERPHTITTTRHIARTFGPDAVPGPCPVQPGWKGLGHHKASQAPAAAAAHGPDARVGPCECEGQAAAARAMEVNGLENGSSAGTADSEQAAPGAALVTPAAAGPPSHTPPAPAAQAHPSCPPLPSQATNGSSCLAASTLPDQLPAAGQQGSGAGGAQGEDTRLGELKGEWFKAYAYPLTDQTWVTWSEDPEEWLPLNHSCDPNCWLEGLDLVARRPIRKGEEVTADYATYSVHNMQEFQCQCGAASCRGTVRGTDYLEDWVEQLYGDHLSDYVSSKRREAKTLTATAAAAL